MGHTIICWHVVFLMLGFTRVSSPMQTAVFYGGYINYDLEHQNGTYTAHVQIITGWELGTGPCGPNCSRNHVGTSTLITRRSIEQSTQNNIRFGNYTYETEEHKRIKMINEALVGTIQETVVAVSGSDHWEQEIATFSIQINETKEADIVAEGSFWKELTIQKQPNGPLPWHLQTHITPVIRNDTKKPNKAPKLLPKPFYKILLNMTTIINFPAFDEDDDRIECSKSQFSEAGFLNKGAIPSGIDVFPNCSVKIEATLENNYTAETWIAISLNARDYSTINFNGGNFALSSSTFQFIVLVTSRLTSPRFVSPSEASSTEFIVYADAVWTTKIFAESSHDVHFNLLCSRNETVLVSAVTDDPDGRENVQYVELRWIPSRSEIGHHMVCLTVTDINGLDSNERRCFNLQVRDRLSEIWQNSTTTISTDEPYFVDNPLGSVSCPMNVYCTIPVFVNAKRGLKDIIITRNYLNSASLTFFRNVTHNGTMLYATDLTYRNFSGGDGVICLQATDIQFKSCEICINVLVFPPNPCLSRPCMNSGTCVPDNDNSGLFKCICPEHYSGRLCSQLEESCPVGICNHGRCIPRNPGYGCFCSDDGETANIYSYPNCLNKTNTCLPNKCVSNELCVDGISNYTCMKLPPQTTSNCSSCAVGTFCDTNTVTRQQFYLYHQ
ncbi:uncharacterized protein LOC127857377 [Dreissena polymorpha]|uniref:uncharacterized protein LOC127857377 n=1 Tax=Dreissena polymorpha TaxID=45954 RepID=UPI002264502B|nr:uncharacterized protein LOC127857377 [Dreissena polymorpha]